MNRYDMHIADLRRQIAALEHGLRRMYLRHLNQGGVGTLVLTDDSGGAQRMQVRMSQGELIDAVPNAQMFGFASNMPPGSDANVTVHFLEGRRSKGVVVATGHQQHRPRNVPVGGCVVHDANGQTIALSGTTITITAGQDLHIIAPGKVRIETPTLEVTGEIIANADNGPIHVTTHRDTGVQTGAGQTQAPVAGS